MGCLDPKLDKARTFELLRKRGVKQAVLQFEGGHDDGSVQSITLLLEDGSERDLEVWYCGGYTYSVTTKAFTNPISTPENENEELSDLLQGPIDEKFSSWDGVNSTYGTLTWTVEGEGCLLQYEQDRPTSIEVEFFSDTPTSDVEVSDG